MNNDYLDLEFIDLGLCEYSVALEKQVFYHKQCLQNKIKGVVIKTEHPNVITLGKNATYQDLLYGRDFYINQNIQIFETERGGKLTAHMPGQLVVYPILKILDFNIFPKTYVKILENAVIKTLEFFGINARTIQGNSGVWVDDKKICSIGIRIADRVTMHGLALNVCNSLDLFSLIVPCGMPSPKFTSISLELGKLITVNEVWEVFKKNFYDLIITKSKVTFKI